MWGAMNELWDYHDEAIRLAKELERIKKELDPYRLSCVAFHAFTWEKPYKQNSKEMFNISDINAVNVYESWYHGISPLLLLCSMSSGTILKTNRVFFRSSVPVAMNGYIHILHGLSTFLRSSSWLLIVSISIRWNPDRIM